MTKPGNAWAADPTNLSKTAFNLNSFYFDLQGDTGGTDNFLEVFGYNDLGVKVASATFKLDQVPADYSPSVLTLAHGTNNQNQVAYPGTALSATDKILMNAGYFVFLDSSFDNVYSVDFVAKDLGIPVSTTYVPAMTMASSAQSRFRPPLGCFLAELALSEPHHAAVARAKRAPCGRVRPPNVLDRPA